MKYLIIFSLFVIFTSCKEQENSVQKFTLYKPTIGNLIKSVQVSGKITPAYQFELKSTISGKVRELKVSLGQEIKKGSAILIFDSADLQKELLEKKKQLDSKQIEIKNSLIEIDSQKKALEQAKYLFKKKIGPQKDIESANKQLQVLNNTHKIRLQEFASMKETINLQERNQNNLAITSPIDGVVTYLWLGANTFISGNSVKDGEKLVVISNLSSLQIQSPVQEKDASFLKLKASVQVTIPSLPDKEIKGHIESISPVPQVDSETGISTYTIIIKLQAPPQEVRVGMSADCAIEYETRENVLILPLNTIKNDGTNDYVEIANNNILEKKIIKIGLTNDMEAEILEGITEQDLVKVW